MTQCDNVCAELLQNGHGDNSSSNESPASGKNSVVGRNSPNTKKPPTSPKSVPTTANVARRPLFCDMKRRRVDKFYQKQSSLVECFEQDSKQIQNFQQRRLNSQCSLEVRRTLSSEFQNFNTSTNAHLLENGMEPMEEFEDSTLNRLLETSENILLPVKTAGNGTIALPKVRVIHSPQSLHDCAPRSPSVMTSSTARSSSSNTELARASRRLALLSLLVNLALILAKGVASFMSGSLSIFSSLVDSCVDITSGFVIWFTGRLIRKHDPYLYPVGRTRLEPAALVIVSVIMAVASVQMIVQSLEAVANDRVHPRVDWSTIAIMVTTVVVKLVLFLLCRRLNACSSSRVLAQDHRNDCLSNSIALLCAFGAQKFWLYLDPIGAILVSLYIAATWCRTGKEHLIMLSGRSAKPEFINRIIKVCIDHDEQIKFIDTVLVYHFGLRFLVEVHIGLDERMCVKKAHDIAESLQNSIESLPEVERAFVHVDYEFEHKMRDEHKVP